MEWRKKPQRKSSNDTPLPFWVSCPKCHEKFSVPQAWVLKYLARTIGYEHEEKAP